MRADVSHGAGVRTRPASGTTGRHRRRAARIWLRQPTRARHLLGDGGAYDDLDGPSLALLSWLVLCDEGEEKGKQNRRPRRPLAGRRIGKRKTEIRDEISHVSGPGHPFQVGTVDLQRGVDAVEDHPAGESGGYTPINGGAFTGPGCSGARRLRSRRRATSLPTAGADEGSPLPRLAGHRRRLRRRRFPSPRPGSVPPGP